MTITKVAMLVLAIALALYILIPNLSWAEDGAALYKAQCSVCDGLDGAGKPVAKVPSVVAVDDKIVW
ncbi:MAG TPA: cytochrome c [Terriglobales bacterium]|jgi:hypothetical protein